MSVLDDIVAGVREDVAARQAATPLPDVQAAAAAGQYVVLDLQPGRTDFLTQARRYESLLTEPNVGLALDPEWRLAPDQVPLRQIGGVDASEVEHLDWGSFTHFSDPDGNTWAVQQLKVRAEKPLIPREDRGRFGEGVEL